LNRKTESVWVLVLIAANVSIAASVLAGCGGRPAPAVTLQPPAPAATASRQSADVPPDEPAIMPHAPTAVPTATARPTRTTISQPPTPTPAAPTATPEPTTTFPSQDPYPLQIEVMRQQSYPGSEIVIEQTRALYTYPNDNHNISKNFAAAMQRTITFFDQYVKGS
jgi:hypothetical protein